MTPLQHLSELAKKLNGEQLSRAARPTRPSSRTVDQEQPPSHVFFGLPRKEELGPERLFQQVQSNFQYLQNKLSSGSAPIKRSVMLDSRIMHGNPVFVGTRIPLYRIVEELADGASLEDLVDGYPSLSIEQIQAGLDFAASLLRIYDD
jgi:uncharacterized protein (DUF433 family)